MKKARFSFFFFFYAISSTLIYSRYYYYFFFFIQLDQNETRFDRGWNRFRNGPLTILFEHVWIILFPIRLLIILPVKINWHTPEVNNRWSPVAIIIDPLRHPSNWWWKPRQQSFVENEWCIGRQISNHRNCKKKRKISPRISKKKSFSSFFLLISINPNNWSINSINFNKYPQQYGQRLAR